MGVDIDGDFTPQYLPVKDRADVIADLKKRAKSADTVYLATDPDREGEAISWHLKELLNLPDDKAKRVTFNEITKKVVTESIQHPREIDQDLVDAQQARRILDRIVGYKLSPLLWRKVKPGLSAGRVQSVATRIVVDRENEIRAFQPQEYWLLDALLDCGAGTFTARFYGTADKKMDVQDEATADKIIAAVSAEPFQIASVKRGEKQRSPLPPFITSTLQQEASRRLGMTPRRTMSVAQQLYEGVDITDRGTIGLITYMRTDSQRLSDEALAAAQSFIVEHYGPEYHPGKPRTYKTKPAHRTRTRPSARRTSRSRRIACATTLRRSSTGSTGSSGAASRPARCPTPCTTTSSWMPAARAISSAPTTPSRSSLATPPCMKRRRTRRRAKCAVRCRRSSRRCRGA